MKVDLWIPTATPFDEYTSRYPYALDGKIPAPPDSGLLEPLTTLSFLAAHTATARLGTAMVLLPQRNPVYTAKEVATLDWLSGGRVDFGVGVGWLEEEFDAVNVPWAHRGKRTDEYLQVLGTLWCDDRSAFEGEFYSLPRCSMFPKPVQSPHPPIHVGGESRAALARVARFGQGWHTFNRKPEDLAVPLAELDRLLEEDGRRRSDVTITVCPDFEPLDAEIAARYAETGADAVAALLLPFGEAGVIEALDTLQPVIDRAATS